jgi:hypothetical protein
MLDHPKKTARLLAKLEKAVPFEVQLVPSAVTYLEEKGIASATVGRHTLESVTYAGDEGGGIMCRLTTAGTNDMLIVSLSQVKVSLSAPLALSILDYQRHRAKNLKKQGWTGVDYAEFPGPRGQRRTR